MESYNSFLTLVSDLWSQSLVSTQVDYSWISTLLGYQKSVKEDIFESERANAQEIVSKTKSFFEGKKEIDLRGETVKFGADMIEVFIEVSEALHIQKPIQAVDLVVQAVNKIQQLGRKPQHAQHHKMLILKYCFELHFTKRHNLLISLLDLVLILNHSEQFDNEVVLIVRQFIDNLIEEGLLLHLIKLIADIQTRTHVHVKNEHIKESKHAIMILFSIYQHRAIDWSICHPLLKLIKKTAALSSEEDNSLSNHNIWTGYMLCITLKSSLQVVVNIEANNSGVVVVNKQLIDEIQLFLTRWHQEGCNDVNSLQIISLFYIIVALFLRTMKITDNMITSRNSYNIDDKWVTKVIQQALSLQLQKPTVDNSGCLYVFAQMHENFLYYIEFESVEAKKQICLTLSTLFYDLFEHFPMEMEQMMRSDEKFLDRYRANKNMLADNDVSLPNTNFTGLFSMIAYVFTTYPRTIEVLLNSKSFFTFLSKPQYDVYGLGGGLTVDLHSVLLPSFVDLLTALCESDYGCQHAFELIEKSLRFKVPWSTIFHYFDRQLSKLLTIHSTQPQHQQYQRNNTIIKQQIVHHASNHRLDPWSSMTMICLLKLLESVIRYNENKKLLARKEFSPLDKLFQLLICPFSPLLKAQIFKTLSAFAMNSPSLSVEIWNRLDASQAIGSGNDMNDDININKHHNNNGMNDNDDNKHNNNDNNNQVKYGLHFEFEVEQRNGTYPITVSFLELLLTLLSNSMFDWLHEDRILKYIRFVLHEVFLNIEQKTYSPNDGETQRVSKNKDYWIMSETCIAILVQIAAKYDPSTASEEYCRLMRSINVEHNNIQQNNNKCTPSAGYELFNKILDAERGQEVFSPLLLILVRAFRILDEPNVASDTTTTGGDLRGHIESFAFFGLQFLCHIIHKEEIFCANLQQASEGIRRLSCIRDLLLGTEEGHLGIAGIAKIIGYTCELSSKTYAQRICRMRDRNNMNNVFSNNNNSTIMSSMLNNSQDNVMSRNDDEEIPQDNSELAFYACQLLRLLSKSQKHSDTIVNILEHNDESGNVKVALASQLTNVVLLNETSNMNTNINPYQDRTRIAIIQLLLSNIQVSNSQFNLVHLLLGFTDKENVQNSDLHKQTGKNSSIHGRIVLDTILSLVRKPKFCYIYPALAEAVFELFYRLSSHSLTSTPFLRFLAKEPFCEFLFFNLLEELPPLATATDHSMKVTLLLQQAHLLKSIALVLYKTAGKFSISNDTMRSDNYEMDAFREEALQRLGFLNENESSQNASIQKIRIIELLDAMETTLPLAPQREIPHEICGIPIKKMKLGQNKYDIKNIYKLGKLDPSIRDRKQAEDIAEACLTMNTIAMVKQAASSAFAGWKQVVQVCLYSSLPPYLQQLDQDRYQSFCFTLVRQLLIKLNDLNPLWHALGVGLSQVALSLMANIREEEELNGWRSREGFFSASSTNRKENFLELILNAILKNDYATRCHLYGVYFNYKQFIGLSLLSGNTDESFYNETKQNYKSEVYMLRKLEETKAKEAQETYFRSESGLQLLQKAQQDATNGASLQSLAFVFLSSLLEEIPSMLVLSSQTQSGYTFSHNILSVEELNKVQWSKQIESFVETMLEQLERKESSSSFNNYNTGGMLSQTLQQLDSITQRKFYSHALFYESIFAFLLKLATIKVENNSGEYLYPGVQILPKRLVLRLSEYKFLRPSHIHSFNLERFEEVRSIEQYLQVLLPSLRLIVSILTSQSSRFPDVQLHEDTFQFLQGQENMIIFVFDIIRRIYSRFYRNGNGTIHNNHNSIISNDLLCFLISPLEATYLLISIYRTLSSSPLLTSNNNNQNNNQNIVRFIAKRAKILPVLCEIMQASGMKTITQQIEAYNHTRTMSKETKKREIPVLNDSFVTQLNELESNISINILHLYHIMMTSTIYDNNNDNNDNQNNNQNNYIYIPLFAENNTQNDFVSNSMYLGSLLNIIDYTQTRLKQKLTEANKLKEIMNQLGGVNIYQKKKQTVTSTQIHRSSDLKQLSQEYELAGTVISEVQAFKQLKPKLGILYNSIHELFSTLELCNVILYLHVTRFLVESPSLVNNIGSFINTLQSKCHRLGRVTDVVPESMNHSTNSNQLELNKINNSVLFIEELRIRIENRILCQFDEITDQRY